jgi:hypothetical protein
VNKFNNLLLILIGIHVAALIEYVANIFFINDVLRYLFMAIIFALVVVCYLKVSIVPDSIKNTVLRNKHTLLFIACLITIHTSAYNLFVTSQVNVSNFLISAHILISTIAITFVFFKQFKKMES